MQFFNPIVRAAGHGGRLASNWTGKQKQNADAASTNGNRGD